MTDRYASLKQGLVGCWIPSISGSGLLLPDLSGRGNNGSLTNMDASDWVSSQYGRALDFDGVNDYVNLADTNALRITSGSITGWFRSAPLGAGVYKCIFASYAQSATVVSGISLGINISATNIDQLGVVIGRNAGNSSSDVGHWYSSATVTDSLLHSFAVVIASDGSVVIYVDGKQTTTTRTFGSTVSPVYATINYVGIGAEQTGPTYGTGKYWPNILDDIRAYNRAITESEIKLLASEPGIGFKPAKKLSRFSQRYTYKPPKARNYGVIRNRDPNYSTLRQGLVTAYCPSISGQGNVLPDLVGGNHGTLTNMDASDWVSSGDGRALDFDGSNDVVSISGSVVYAQNGQPFTASIHAYVRNFTNQYTKLLMLRSDCVNGNAWEFGVSDQSAYLGILIGTNGSYARIKTDTLAATITSGWHHYLVVYNGGDRSQSTSFRIYFDGTLQVNSGAIDFSGTTNTSSISLNAANNRLNGVADDVRIYSRALTEPEIKLLASKRGIGLQPRNTHVTFADLGVQKTYSVVRVKETDYATLRQGLVGAWCPSLPNGGSGNTLPDVSGYGNHGVLTNMSPDDWVSSQYGRALDFDGVNDHVVASHQPFASLQQGTISGWVNTSNDVNQCLFALANTSNSNQFAFFGYGGDQTGTLTNELIYFIIRGFAGTDLATFGYATSNRTELIDGSWHHIAIVVNGTSASSIYLDGVSRSISVSNQYPTSNQGQFFGDLTGLNKCLIAAYQLGADLGGYASGRQDDIRIYSRALTESEIRLLASRPGIGLRQESHRQTFYQFPSFQPALAKRSSVIIGGGIT